MDYKPQEPGASPEEFEIVISDPSKYPVPEVEAFLDGIAELNAIKSKSIGKNIYRLEEQIREDLNVGKYTALVISEFDGEGKSRPIQIITFVDKTTGMPLANVFNVELKKVNNTLRSKGLEAFARKRGVQLAVARTKKLRVKFAPESDNGAKQAARLKRRLRGEKDEQ